MSGHPMSAAITAALLAALLGYAPPSHAYLDPGTGSMILSAIIGLIATVALTFKTWWYRIRRLFRREDRDAPRPRQPGEEEPSSGADS